MSATTELAVPPSAGSADDKELIASVPQNGAAMEARLGAYLGASVPRFRMLASGWETTVFEFSIGSRSSRFRDLPVDQPLVLRFYQGSQADDKGSREAVTMRLLADNSCPVPRPYLYEADHEPLGSPFLIMERVGGGPLFVTNSFPNAFKTFSLAFIAFVRAQTAFHQLGTARRDLTDAVSPAFVGSKKVDASLADRLLGIIADRIEQGPLPGLHDALNRLLERAPRFSPSPRTLVHMDYHPQNVIVRGLRVTGIIDWVNADRGDRHLCAATTAVILSTSAMEKPRWMRDNPAGNGLRAMFAAMYLPLYHALAPMELERFRFAQALAGMLRLSMFGMMRARGPESVGFRPEAIQNVTPDVVKLLSRYTARKCRAPVSIASPGATS